MEAKKIIITGGATRIGAAIAKSLVSYDTKISIHFNKSRNSALKLKKELEEIGAEAYLIKGMIYNLLDNTDLAQSSYQTAIEVNPDYYDAYILLGILHEKLGNNIAINYYNSAAEVNPN